MKSLEFNCEHSDVLDVDLLKENPRNPNSHSQEQIERLAKNIKTLGWRSPIVISNQSGFIVAGHGRLASARHLGLRRVPVDFQDFESEDFEYAHLVADNALQEYSTLDLAAVNAEIANLGPMDVDLLGLREFSIEPMDNFNEPKEKKTPEEKDAEMKTCPNCGVLINE